LINIDIYDMIQSTRGRRKYPGEMRGWIMRERKQHYGAERMRPIHEQQSRIINFFQGQRSSPQKKFPSKKFHSKNFALKKFLSNMRRMTGVGSDCGITGNRDMRCTDKSV
jgi:hypothetical protein